MVGKDSKHLNSGGVEEVFLSDLIWLVIDARDIAPGDDVHRRENGEKRLNLQRAISRHVLK
jgi:hypothetical protein